MPEAFSIPASEKWNAVGPALLVLLLASFIVGATIWRSGGDPMTLARIGTRFAEGDPNGSEGYDGQFVYFIARDPNPQRAAQFLDVPAYRYQRILLPILARLTAFGKLAVIPWSLVILNILALAAGTWFVSRLLTEWGISSWYAMIYGLWAGFLLALIVDLPEPLAFALVGGGLLASKREKKGLTWILFGLALFAKESTVIFLGALLLSYLAERRWGDACGLALIGGLPFMIFQGWLWITFGQPGIGSGGAMATAFEWIPFMGLLRIGASSLTYLLAMLVVFGPSVVLPSAWGMWQSARIWLAGERNVFVCSLFLNGLAIAVMPFSTFRETGGILRYASGLVLAVVLFAGRYKLRRGLNYALFWIVLNVFLLK